MDDRKESLKYLLRQFLFALPLFGVGIYLLLPIPVEAEKPIKMLSAFFLLLGALLIGKPIAALFSSSASSILFPATAGREVMLVFSIPEGKIIAGKYEEALALYLEMIPLDPERLEIYMRIMDLAAYKMKQPETAREAFCTGLKNIKDIEDRQTLAGQYKRITEV